MNESDEGKTYKKRPGPKKTLRPCVYLYMFEEKTRWDHDEPTDPELDPYSPKFNPLKALYSEPEIKLPDPNAPVYDNLSKFISLMETTAPTCVLPRDLADTYVRQCIEVDEKCPRAFESFT